MRNLLSLESVNVAPAAVLSLEEEAVVISEVVADSAAIDAELAEAARATDVSESLEDLAVIADNIEEATPIEGALFDTAANMAVAGTDIEPTALVPASESFKGRKLATESQGLKDRAKAIWVQIKEALKRIWARIESFFYKYFGTLPGLKRDIESARKKVQAASGLGIEKAKFTLASGLRTLTVNGTILKSGSDVKSSLKDMEAVSVLVFKNDDTAKGAGEAIFNALTDFDVAKPNDGISKLCSDLAKVITSNVKGPVKATSAFNARYPGFTISASAPLFDNKTIIVKEAKSTSGDATPGIQSLMHMAKTGSFNVQTTDKVPNTPESVEFTTLTISDMTEILDICENLASTVESYQRGKNLKEANSFKDKLSSAAEKASASVARLEVSEDTNDRAAVAAYRALINMNLFYCNLLANPSIGLATNVQTTIRTMLSLVSKSLAQYK